MKKFAAVIFCLFYYRGLAESYFSDDYENDPEYIDINEKNITFTLYTRRNPYHGVPLYINDTLALLSSGFNGTLPTKITTHGFMDSGETSFILKMKYEFLDLEDLNFISLDWSACAKNLRYDRTVRCMKKVGLYVGEFLRFLQKKGKFDVKKAHLIGHSLGAHLFAFTSIGFGEKKTIGRITGLDPAGPLFEHADESQRLSSSSANFVDIIHTCRIFTGIKKPIGTVDFYPNGGYNQPGCSNVDMRCNHKFSHKYFIHTITKRKNDVYVGKKCETLDHAINGTCAGELGVMGYYSEKSSPGIYYLKITEPPQRLKKKKYYK